MTPVYVPSKGRAGRSATLSSLSAEEHPAVWIVTPPEETAAYRDTYGSQSGWHVVPQAGDGIWGARQSILDHARIEGRRFWMLDDDCTGAFWREGHRLKRSSLWSVMLAMEDVVRARRVAVAMYGPNFRHRAWSGPVTEWDVHLRNFVNLDPAIPFDYWDNVKEDLDMVLQIITSGRHTLRFNAYAFDSPRMGTTDGGCWDDYLTGALDVASHELPGRWPGLVSMELDQKSGYVTNRVNWKAARAVGAQRGFTTSG